MNINNLIEAVGFGTTNKIFPSEKQLPAGEGYLDLAKGKYQENETPKWRSFPTQVWGVDLHGRRFIRTRPFITTTPKIGLEENISEIRRSPLTIWERYSRQDHPVNISVPGSTRHFVLPEERIEEFADFLANPEFGNAGGPFLLEDGNKPIQVLPRKVPVQMTRSRRKPVEGQGVLWLKEIGSDLGEWELFKFENRISDKPPFNYTDDRFLKDVRDKIKKEERDLADLQEANTAEEAVEAVAGDEVAV